MPAIVTDFDELDLNGTYTYADYLLWQFKERVELIKGKIFQMSPAPNTRHQTIAGKLYLKIGIFLEDHSCRAFFAPFDVRLFDSKKSALANLDVYTVVQPDLCVICDSAKLDERGCLGAPDLVVEILSPGNSQKEMYSKFLLYQECGVREYWLVDSDRNAVWIYVLNENGRYFGQQPAVKVLQSTIFPGLKIDLEKVFD
ncbi:MAG: restriction endonuclease [Dyadobacter sp. 50-39]|uniref:Uma2 family endonuclease n=1 Tax=Dyadobacter sp. 50-39 TaxID=1895756 RepID=UPI0009590A99|nr:Uma2 family endonuclease [Dyadobacter sp. 50-39]OJV20122.1 MAG: restriction endonuclease [Dyadobacter sp. 50-39]